MSDATLDPEFLAWARPQLRGRLFGPARMTMVLLLLKNLWEKDPAIRDNYRAMKAHPTCSNPMHLASAAVAAWGEYAPFRIAHPELTEEDVMRVITKDPNDRQLFPHRYRECLGFPNLTTFGIGVKAVRP